MELVPDKIEAFLKFDDVVNSNEQIRKSTDALICSRIEIERVAAIFNWVRDTISHSKDFGHECVTCTSSEVLHHRTGICFAKSHLLASMMRYAGIPCGFCYQVFENPANRNCNGFTLHGLNAVYVQSTRSWQRIDPRGNRSDISAVFSKGNESLAFPDLDFLDDKVYASPLPVVIDGLKTAESISSLWPHLPSIANDR